MKTSICFLLLLLFLIPETWAQNSLSGYVYDHQTNNPLPGASIYIPDLNTGTASDEHGYFILKNLPATKLLFQVKFIGYATATRFVNLKERDTINFYLQPSSIEGKEVVITGTAITSESERNSVAVKTVDRIDIVTIPTTNIIDALAHTPGVSQITTGNAISKPVIRGLSFNRIITLNDGIRQEGQQWGDEHGIEIDKYSADRIEVMRGPASLMYGSDALGGVINILEPVTPEINALKGNITSQFYTNEKLTGNSLMVEGNKNGIFGRLRGTFTDAAAYQTPERKIENTGFREINFNSTIGINKKWGFTNLNFSRYDAYFGLAEITQTPDEEPKDGEEETNAKGRNISLPYQQVIHNKFSLNNRIYIGNSQLSVKAGLQQNERKEFETEIDHADIYLNLNSLTTDIKFFFPEKNNWQRVIGISAMHQVNKNKGEGFLIPDFELNESGVFLYIRKSNPKTSWNAGVRFDLREVVSKELILKDVIADTIFNSFTKDFSAATGAIGMTLRFSEIIHMKANIGSGFRAPNISELASNGIHSGTFRYEKGNNNLNPEQSLQFDIGLLAHSKKVDGEINFFANYISNYIYPRPTGEIYLSSDNILLPLYHYTQGNALLKGFEFSLDAHVLHNLHFENGISFVYGENLKTENPLPFMPPMAMHNELRFDFHFLETKFIKEPYLKFSVDNHLPQKRIDESETETVGYSLINAGIGTAFSIRKANWIVAISANNIGDKKYSDHLNRLKNFGIYNKGRNVSFSIFIPFAIYSGS